VQNVPPKPTHCAAKILNPTQSDFKYSTDFGKSVRFHRLRIRNPVTYLSQGSYPSCRNSHHI